MNVEKSLHEMLKILRFWYSFLNMSKYKNFSGEIKKICKFVFCQGKQFDFGHNF